MKVLHNGKALIVGTEPFDLKYYPNLQVIGCNMTGTEHLPWDEINRRGIKVISLKDYPEFLKDITSTAEHTIGLIIALLRNYKTALNAPYQDREAYKGQRLSGKTLGIIGYGRVGKQVSRVAHSLGMNVLIYDTNMDFNTEDWAPTIEVLLRNSDVVTTHIPLKGNEGFFDRSLFKQMKEGASFINTSRSGVVEEGALLWALENKIIHSAAVDFIDEPELLEYSKCNNNLLLTNHIGGMTHQDTQATEDFIIKQVENHLHNI